MGSIGHSYSIVRPVFEKERKKAEKIEEVIQKDLCMYKNVKHVLCYAVYWYIDCFECLLAA